MHHLLAELFPPSVEANEAQAKAEPAWELADIVVPPPSRQHGPVVGLLWEIDRDGVPQVFFPDGRGDRPMPARSLGPLGKEMIGRKVGLFFEDGTPAQSLVMGVVQEPRPEPIRTEIDGEKLVFTAEREIVLRCGDASITLTRAGKVLIRGTYVLSRSSGVNR